MLKNRDWFQNLKQIGVIVHVKRIFIYTFCPNIETACWHEHFYVNAYVYAYMQECEVSIYLSTVTLL